MKYPIQEIFYSLQAEGSKAGNAAIFIRLAGCNIGCPWCDTKETWKIDKEKVEFLNAKQISKKIKSYSGKFVVITGGEPSLYDLKELVNELHSQNYYIAMETAGTNPITAPIDWICLSPKTRKAPLSENLIKTNELKVVISEKKDFLFAEKMKEQCSKDCLFYLQTEWSKNLEISNKLIEYIKQKPTWKLSIQLHKILNIR